MSYHTLRWGYTIELRPARIGYWFRIRAPHGPVTRRRWRPTTSSARTAAALWVERAAARRIGPSWHN